MIAVWDANPETTGFVVTVDYICRQDGAEASCQRVLSVPKMLPPMLMFLTGDVVRITRITAKAFKETGAVTIDLNKERQ